MKRNTLLNPILILSLVLASVASLAHPGPALASGASAPTPPADMFVIGTGPTYNNPVLFRMDTEGAIVWQTPLPFTHFLDLDINADRNLTEDAFYMAADAYFRSNLIDGKVRIMRYTADGQLDWDVPLSPNAWGVSANPVYGGIYVADLYQGIYRMDSDGNVAWGPLNFGYTGGTLWSVTTDTTDGGAFVSERHNGVVMKIDGNGNVLWTRTGLDPVRLEPSPADGGVYVGAGDYARATYKLSASGTIEWSKDYFPSYQNSPRNVNPFNGNLYVVGAWSTRLASVAPDGTVAWDISSEVKGIARFAVDMSEGGAYLYGAEMWDRLGITKIDAATGAIVWRRDPGFYTYTGGDPTPFYLVYSGMPSNVPSADLSADLANTEDIYPGDPVSVDLNIQNAEDLYAAQALCAVDPSVLELQDGTFGDFFDSTDRLIAANQADALAGEWLGAISQQNPAGPLSGDGLYATLDYIAAAPGTTELTCEPLFSDRNGFALPVTFTGVDITVIPFGIIDGQALYQGRLDHAGIQVTATGPVTQTVTTDSAGAFALDQLKAGSYVVEADAASYLPNCTTTSVTSGGTTTLPMTTLLGGDVNDFMNGDLLINIGDVTLLTANFNLEVPGIDPPVELTQSDINADGIVNVQDLAILAGNYGISGCQDW